MARLMIVTQYAGSKDGEGVCQREVPISSPARRRVTSTIDDGVESKRRLRKTVKDLNVRADSKVRRAPTIVLVTTLTDAHDLVLIVTLTTRLLTDAKPRGGVLIQRC